MLLYYFSHLKILYYFFKMYFSKLKQKKQIKNLARNRRMQASKSEFRYPKIEF